MSRLLWTLITVVVLFTACIRQPVSDRTPLETILGAHVGSGFSGTVLVARGRDILLARGFEMANGKPISPGDRFWIASTAKQFVAAAVLKLMDEGQLRLDDPLQRFFSNVPPDKAAITLRQLLSHTSGIGQSYSSEGFSQQGPAVAAMLAEPLTARPGRGFIYSNSNIQLAAAVVERVSGSAYPEYVRRVLWRPAVLESTGFAGDFAAASVLPARMQFPARLAKDSWGGQGVYSTAVDLFRWVRAVREGRVLKAGTVDLLFRAVPYARTREGAATLGWFVDSSSRGTRRAFIRGNEDFGANSLIYFYPQEDVTIIVLTHAGDVGDLSWSRTVHADLERGMGL